MQDEKLATAVAEVDAAILAALPTDCQHEFSQDFYAKMHEICPSIDPETGAVKN